MIRKWSRIEESCGPEALQHKNQNKVWTAEEKYELVTQQKSNRIRRAALTAMDCSCSSQENYIHGRLFCSTDKKSAPADSASKGVDFYEKQRNRKPSLYLRPHHR